MRRLGLHDPAHDDYDGLGRLVERNYAHRVWGGSSWTTEYSVTDATIFDGLDRPTQTSNQTLPTTGGLSSTGVPAVTTTYAYFYAAGYLIAERRQFVGPDAHAETQAFHYFGPFGQLWYVIDQDQSATGGALTFARGDVHLLYDRSGALAETYRKTEFDAGPLNNFKNFVRTQYAYDGAGRLASLAHTALRHETSWGTYQPLATFAYQYDSADRISQLGTDWNTSLAALATRTDETQALQYDNAGQLVSLDSNLPGGGSAYLYGPSGNRTLAIEPAGGIDFYQTAAQNRVEQDSTHRYVYDFEGNLLERRLLAGDVLAARYTWDHRDRLTKVETFSGGVPAETIDYRYDAAGGLVRRTVDPAGAPPAVVEQYVLEGGRRALTLDGGTTTAKVARRYQYGLTGEVIYDQVFNAAGQSIERYEPLGDHQHSTRILLEHGGANDVGAAVVRQSVDYGPFGAVQQVRNAAGAVTTAALDTAFGHHGSVQDSATGLQLKGARWHSPDLGRFMSEDPDGFAGGDANLYRFAGNDPVNFADPSGLRQAGHPLAAKPFTGVDPTSRLIATAGPVAPRVAAPAVNSAQVAKRSAWAEF